MSETVRIVPCPTCRQPAPWLPSNPHRPFCSERCRLIDFGGWADERYRIEGGPLEDLTAEDLSGDWRGL